MGYISKTIEEMLYDINKILELAHEIDTERLQRDMLLRVFKCFYALKPLSYKFQVIRQINEAKDEYYKDYLAIGEWLRIKSEWQSYGSTITNTDTTTFFNIIRKFGDDLKPHVRRPIREDFSKLVDLTKQLIPYNNTKISMKIDPPKKVLFYFIEYKDEGARVMKTEKYTVKEIELETHYPLYINLKMPDGKIQHIYIIRPSNIQVIEDLLNDIMKLYEKADSELSYIKKHNNEILKKMEEISLPYIINKKIK